MALKIYQKFGLRRDKNLEDLSNPVSALSNVLDNITDDEFTAEDLGVIKGIYSAGLEQGTFLEVGGSAEESTDSDGRTAPLTPYISYQNRLDLSTLYAGTPRIYGGDGPNAKYYDFSQVENPLPTDPTINTGMWIVSNGVVTEPIAEDQFWEKGGFSWDRKLHEKSANVGGGIEWEGYYVPTGTGFHNFSVSTTGCWTFDFQKSDYSNAFIPNTDWDTKNTTAQGANNTGIYSNQLTDTHSTVYKNYAFVTPEVDISCTRYNNETLQIVNQSDYNKIAIGMTCINDTYIEGGTQGAKVSEYTTSNGRIKLSDTLVDGSTNASPVKGSGTFSGAQTIKFKQGADQSTNAQWRVDYPLVKGVPYRIKFRYFTPQYWDTNRSERFYNVIESIPNGGNQSSLNYRKLYSLTYDFSEKAKGSFNKFLDTSILYGGGETGGTNHSNYITIMTDKKIDVQYDPINLTLSNDYDSSYYGGKRYPYKKIVLWTGTADVVQGTTTMSIDNTSGIEVGNYIYDYSWGSDPDKNTQNWQRAIADGTRIIEVITNSSIVLDSPFTQTSSTEFKIIEHRGHIGRLIGKCTSGSDTLSLIHYNGPSQNIYTPSGSGLTYKSKMIVVGEHLPINTQIKLRPTTPGSITLTQNATSTQFEQQFYIYDYQGLTNDSMLAFCEPGGNITQNNCILVSDQTQVDNNLDGSPDGNTDVLVGSYKIGVDSSVSNVTFGNIFADSNAGSRVLGYYFAENTRVIAKDGNSTPRTITLNNATSKLLKAGNNFTVTTAPATAGDKSLCCTPKDTAPPFAANDDGMETVLNHETLDVFSGNVKFDNIRATIKSDQIVEPSGSITYDTFLGTALDKRIRIKSTTDNHTYKLLLSTQ